MAEAAAVLAEVTGRLARLPGADRRGGVGDPASLRRPDWEVEGWVTSYVAIAAGEMAAVTEVVRRLTGHPARTVAEHLRAHPEDWAHLRAEV